jgi:hypothetical protein
MSEKRVTTAAVLISYRNELIRGGVSQDTADEMTRDAGQAITANGELAVRDV